MTRQTPYFPAPYRGPSPRGKQRDPYLYVLVAQTAVCALLLLCALALREAKPELWQAAKVRYEQFLLSDSTVGEALNRLTGEAKTAMERAADAIAQRTPAKDALPAAEPSVPSAPDTEPAPQSAKTDATLSAEPVAVATVGTALPAIADLSGRGGAGTPDNCTFAPVLLTAALQAPTGGRVTSGYGWREHPITGNQDFHRGIDIAAARNSAIHAVLPGVVAETGESPIYGNYIRLDHGHGLQTAYSHCETVVAQQGESLRRGELLATVGSTGVSTGPHVHFELLVNGTYYDPAWAVSGLMSDGD